MICVISVHPGGAVRQWAMSQAILGFSIQPAPSAARTTSANDALKKRFWHSGLAGKLRRSGVMP